MKVTRRLLLKLTLVFGFLTVSIMSIFNKKQLWMSLKQPQNGKSVRDVSKKIETPSKVYHVCNGTPEQNVQKAIEMMGGIQKFIGKSDIVILKPNCQWWNQGRTNLAAIKGFIDIILRIQDFDGEIIIGENHHFMDESLPHGEEDNIRGWTHISEINGDINGVSYNLNGLIDLYHKKGVYNVTKSHWRDGGPKADVWGNGQKGGIVSGPAEGDGYVWSDINYHLEAFWGLKKWVVKMTYPIFTSTYSGITVDFRNGAFLRDGHGGGKYLKDKKIRFINFSVLNDHGATGITSSIKNYMGITDLSCGSWGLKPEGYVNVHQCGEGRLPFTHAKAGPLAYFMKTIRMADLNIVTAEWIGYGHRTDINKAKKVNALLTGIDPVSLDYYGAKKLVYPLSDDKHRHDPDTENSTIRNFLELAAKTLGSGAMNDNDIDVHDYDYNVG